MFMRNKEKKSMGDKRTEKYTFKSYVRGFHVYQEIWTPVIGECLECMLLCRSRGICCVMETKLNRFLLSGMTFLISRNRKLI